MSGKKGAPENKGGAPGRGRRHSISLDEIMRYLFSASPRLQIFTINALFGERIPPDSASAIKLNADFIVEDRDSLLERFVKIEADLICEVRRGESSAEDYHFEFQTEYIGCGPMAERLFQYDFSRAIERGNAGAGHGSEALKALEMGNASNSRAEDGSHLLIMPRTIVIHIEKHSKIPSSYELSIFKDGFRSLYSYPVFKIWSHTAEELREKELYMLIPLKLAEIHGEIDSIYRRKDGKSKREDIRNLILTTLTPVERELGIIHEGRLISRADYDRIYGAIVYLFGYYIDVYKLDILLGEEEGVLMDDSYPQSILEFIKANDTAVLKERIEAAEKKWNEAEAKMEQKIKEAGAKLEQERKEAEARLEQERKEAKARLEQERKETEARLEQERKEREKLQLRFEKLKDAISTIVPGFSFD
ncbi:MAG: hypothetical protein LBU32_19930 [Clostridiales bacterium]|nr:hypothetical protein [Clostridiales bacterium]